MKKTLLLVATFCFTNIGHCQNVDVISLTKIMDSTFDDFDTWMVREGYQFASIETSNKRSKTYTYNRDSNYDVVTITKEVIQYRVTDSFQILIRYFFSDANLYLTMKDELKTNEYKFLFQRQLEKEKLALVYSKRDLVLVLSTYKENSMVTYDLAISRIKKKKGG
jgi:hypothetical protein